MVIIKQNMDDSVLAVMMFCCYRRYQNVIEKKKKLARVNGDDEHKKWNGFKTASSFRGAK